ncbi:GGDEF domain-containing protein [Paenibacillus sp. D51F]
MGIMLVGHLALLGAGLSGAGAGRGLTVLHNLLNSGAFILGNLGIFQLFGETTKRVVRTVYGLLAGAFLLSIIPLASDVYSLILVGFAFVAVKPIMEESRMYQIGLAFYGIATMAHLINDLTGSGTALHVLDNLFRIAYYAVLFIILFDKVLSLMEASYNKSTRDALTGLFNRFYFYTTVSFLVSEEKSISVIFFDLDNFKKLNDTRGHAEGDKALKAVASILREESEEVGVSGRYGGEEMVMVVEDPEVNMGEFAEKIRERIEAETTVTASIGFASRSEGESADELIKNADKAMYVAKKTGKNRVVSFAEMTEMQREIV